MFPVQVFHGVGTLRRRSNFFTREGSFVSLAVCVRSFLGIMNINALLCLSLLLVYFDSLHVEFSF